MRSEMLGATTGEEETWERVERRAGTYIDVVWKVRQSLRAVRGDY